MRYSNFNTNLGRQRPVIAPIASAPSRPTREPGDSIRRRKKPAAIRTFAALWAAAVLTSGLAAQTYTVDLDTPTLDKWVYPFASSGGGPRTSGPTFGAVGNIGTFDDRDGQFFLGFGISGVVPAGQGVGNYAITSASLTLRLSFSVADSVLYDPTYDAVSTYDPLTGGPVGDSDAGRPMELYGAGYRNGFTATTVLENTPYTPTGPSTAEGVRTIFATDFLGGTARDVSNNVRDVFDPLPFAIGQVALGDLNGDGTMMGDIDVVFLLNLANANVVSYLQKSLNEGRVNLLATSLHLASQGGPATRPEFDAKELGLAGVPARFDMVVTVVPEPGAAALLAAGAVLLAGRRRKEAVR